FVEVVGCLVADGGLLYANGPVKVDGLDLVPNPGARVVVDPQHRHIYSEGGYVSIRAGEFEAWKGTFDWHTASFAGQKTVGVTVFPVSPLDFRTLHGLRVSDVIILQFDRQRMAHMSTFVGL